MRAGSRSGDKLNTKIRLTNERAKGSKTVLRGDGKSSERSATECKFRNKKKEKKKGYRGGARVRGVGMKSDG